eukprot:scaffold82_cov366-Pavlova_lutheri.AAC.6
MGGVHGSRDASPLLPGDGFLVGFRLLAVAQGRIPPAMGPGRVTPPQLDECDSGPGKAGDGRVGADRGTVKGGRLGT